MVASLLIFPRRGVSSRAVGKAYKLDGTREADGGDGGDGGVGDLGWWC